MKQLIGHNCENTAYLVEDYPYGFKLRTKIRYWIESRKGYGQRFVSQTMNPKTGRWNKAKAGTYSNIIVMGLDEDTDFVTFKSLGYWHDEKSIRDFASKYVLDQFQIDAAKYLTAAARVSEKIEWKFNAGPATQTPQEQMAIINGAIRHELRAM